MQNLPSVEAAQNLYDGKPGALLEVALTTLARSLIIGTAIYVTGLERDARKAWLSGLAGGIAIETYVLHHTGKQNAMRKV